MYIKQKNKIYIITEIKRIDKNRVVIEYNNKKEILTIDKLYKIIKT